MPYHKIGLNEFFKRFLSESVKDNRPTRKFVWVIGAGMSVTSGIPLAKDVSDRIVILEYYNSLNEGFPWIAPDNFEGDTVFNPRFEFEVYSSTYEGLYDENSLQQYFDWYELQEESGELESHINRAYEWLSTLDNFSNISPLNPECYQLLFEHFILAKDTATAFLSAIIRRAKSVNLGHLALAGILRDFPYWGDTVYTTNFDDLILKSLLLLNKSARVFGEYDTRIGPSLNPNYPQIVHLHGKYTGYSLKNTAGEISNRKPIIQSSFRNHISDSNVIVLGYSGWDDLVMETFLEWNESSELIRGNLYWVPFRNEQTLLPNVHDWLSNLNHTNKAFVLVKDELVDKDELDGGLDADEFMLHMCNFINRDNGGFSPYRQEIVSNAYYQHKFVLDELKKFPKFSPSRLFDIVDLAEQALSDGHVGKFNGYLDYASQIADADDLPERLKCKAYLRMGKALVVSNQPFKAIAYYTKAGNLARLDDIDIPEAKIDRIESLLALANINLNLGHVGNTNKYIRQAKVRIESIKKIHPDIYNRVIYVFSYVMILEEHMTIPYLENFSTELCKSDDYELWEIRFLFLKCMRGLSRKREIGLDRILQDNINFLKKNNQHEIEVADHYLLLAMYNIANENFDIAVDNLILSRKIYTDNSHYVGLGNCFNTEGWMNYSQRNKELALQNFLSATNKYKESFSYYNLGNVLMDAITVSEEILDDNIETLFGMLRDVEKAYLSKRVISFMKSKDLIGDGKKE